jgi:glutamate-ammonia-ligase adenylyltransferase
MRARMRDARKPVEDGLFDIKHGDGGLVDIEFMVQYLVLRCAARHAEILAARGNIALLDALAKAGELNAAHAQVLMDAYRHLLSLDLRQKLGEEGAEASRAVPMDLAGSHSARVCELWKSIFQQPE